MTAAAIDPIVRRLRAHITAYEKETDKSWVRTGEAIVKRYKDERTDAEERRPRFNILWSNVETLKPFLYSSTPKPIVSTRHDDAPQAATVAAEVLQRALAYTIAEGHFGTALRNARDDYLLPGRGTAWVRYKPTFVPDAVQVSESDVSDDPAQMAIPAGEGEDGTEQVQEVVGWEETITDYVHWKDFGHNIAPTWEEVDIVWRRVPMDRDALKERFGEEIGGKIALDWRQVDGATKRDGDDELERAAVYECWWKSKRKAFWVSKTHPSLLDEKEDPLKLDHFFPCPRPIYATLTTDSLIPTPDFKQYRDQANEIDDLTGRIAALTSAIKVAGVYDASVQALQAILQDGHDNELVPVENWKALSEKGGLTNSIELIPIKDIAATLIALHEAREKQKADLYEVTGMSDIVRGNTAPEETATAQQIKANFASKRLAERQSAVERFAANIIAIMGNVIAMHFSIETLREMTGMRLMTAEQKTMAQRAMAQPPAPFPPVPSPQGTPAGAPPAPPPPGSPPAPAMGHNGGPPLDDDIAEALNKPTWEEVIELLRNEPQRRFAIEIETDSLVAPDDQQEQAARTQFLTAVGQFLQQAMQAAEQQPAMVPLLGQMLMFAVKGFRVGRELVDAFEEFVQRMEKQAAQPQQPKPDPAMAKVQGELQLMQERQQFEQQQVAQKAQAEAQQAAHERAMERGQQLHRQRMEVRTANDAHASASAEMQMEAFKAHLDASLAQAAATQKAQIDVLVARINVLGKVEAARITADASADADAEAHQEEQGA